MDSELMSVAEYAEVRGCTTRSVYQRISRGSLDSYLVVRDGKKMLLRQLLTDEGLSECVREVKVSVSECECEPSHALNAILLELVKINQRLERIEEQLKHENPCISKENELPEGSEQVHEQKENTGGKRFLWFFRK